ncbi:Arginine utilization regulatory protein RocR [Olavius sp. associated proteobacterium Delta 1]|nr:Arginine utilization regulatory protein RocR [Olavius sp. associated proteobacterium Delta 1]
MNIELDQSLNLVDIDFLSVLSAFDEGVVIADKSGRIVFYNQTQAQIDDLEPDYVIGKSVPEVYSLDQNSSMILRCITGGQPILGELFVYRTCRGKLVNAVNSVFPLMQHGLVTGAICFIKDYYLLDKKISATPAFSPYEGHGYGNGTRFTFADIIGDDEKFLQSVKEARLTADSPSPVMLYGETGTGKEMFAQSIHNHGPRHASRFIGINCAAIPENLLEGLLFGTSKGAFTGAVNKAGIFEQAHGGTLFLDEVDSMPLNLQTKLLRFLQERKIRRVGGSTDIKIDVKIISSVSNNPQQALQEGQIRMDLFYRLAVVFIPIPPLRELKNGVEALSRHFIYKYNLVLGKSVIGVSEKVIDIFRRYHWPGNVRELEHLIEGTMNVIEAEDIIRMHNLPRHFLPPEFTLLTEEASNPALNNRADAENAPEFRGAQSGQPATDEPHIRAVPESLLGLQKTREKELINIALVKSAGNVSRAARKLSISRQLLHYKMKKYGLARGSY